MNRRSFVQGSVAVGMMGMSTMRSRAQSAGPNQGLVNALISTHAASVAHTFNGAPSAADWTNLASLYTNIYSDYLSKNLDSVLMPAAQRMTAGQINLASTNTESVVQSVQAFQPAFSANNSAVALNAIPADGVPGVLYNLQQFGLATSLNNMAVRCRTMANDLSGTAKTDFKAHIVNAGFSTIGPGPKPQKPPCKPGQACDPGGRGGYNCQVDGALNFAAATAIAVVGFMALPEVAVLAAGFWGVTATWGGIGATGWMFGHAAFCGF